MSTLNVEVFHSTDYNDGIALKEDRLKHGWYWWACVPGCLPDSEPQGPYATEAAAEADAKGDLDDGDDE